MGKHIFARQSVKRLGLLGGAVFGGVEAEDENIKSSSCESCVLVVCVLGVCVRSCFASESVVCIAVMDIHGHALPPPPCHVSATLTKNTFGLK